MKDCEMKKRTITLTSFIFVFLISWNGGIFGSEIEEIHGVSGSDHVSEIVLDSNSTLEDYLRYAALNNEGLKSAFENWRAALEEVEQSGVLPDPRFNYGYFINNVETRVGAQNQRFGLSQTFPWLGKLKLREEASVAMANMAQKKYDSARVALFDEVKQSYFDYYYLGRSIDITAENVLLLKHFVEVARAKYESGTAIYADLLKAQVEYDKMQDRLDTLREQIPALVAQLNAALSRNPEANLPLPGKIQSRIGQNEISGIAGLLKESNPDLLAIDYLLEKEHAGYELAKKNYWPDVTVGLDFVETNDSLMPTVEDSGKDAVMLGFSINLPVWRNKLRAGVSEARNRKNSIIRSRKDLENKLQAKLELAVFKFKDAERKILLYRDNLIGQAEQNLQVTQSAFEAGKVDFLSLIDANRVLLEFQLNFERAVADREKAISTVERIVGKQLN